MQGVEVSAQKEYATVVVTGSLIGLVRFSVLIQDSQNDCTLKSIFHCDAKLLAWGNFALPNAKNGTFALPNAKNTNMLVSLALGDANFLCWPCTFHYLFVDFICVG